MLTENTVHMTGRVDQIVRDYFKSNPSVNEIAAKDLMDLFVEKGIFNKDYSRPGLPIRNLLRQPLPWFVCSDSLKKIKP